MSSMILFEILMGWVKERNPKDKDQKTFNPVTGITVNFSGGTLKYAELIVEGVLVATVSRADFDELVHEFDIALHNGMHSIPAGYRDILKFDDFANDVAGKYIGRAHSSEDEDGEFDYRYQPALGVHEFACNTPSGGTGINSTGTHFDVVRYLMRHRLLVKMGCFDDVARVKTQDQYQEEQDELEFADLLSYLNGGVANGG